MEEQEERTRPGVAKEYRTKQIVVSWAPERCVHSANCLRGLPQVFDARRRPWIAIEAASADDIARVVETCPSGALSYERLHE